MFCAKRRTNEEASSPKAGTTVKRQITSNYCKIRDHTETAKIRQCGIHHWYPYSMLTGSLKRSNSSIAKTQPRKSVRILKTRTKNTVKFHTLLYVLPRRLVHTIAQINYTASLIHCKHYMDQTYFCISCESSRLDV